MRKRLILSIVLLSACGPNELGWNREAAQSNAVAWAKAVGMPEARPVCNAVDTDGDGYVSCAFHLDGTIRTFECAGWSVVRHDGCREPKVKVPAPVVGGHQ